MTVETRLTLSLLATWPVRAGASGSDLQRADTPRMLEHKSVAPTEPPPLVRRAPLIANDLMIELDKEAGRFVLTLTDPGSSEVLRRFPQESQLAYARAVSAYLSARYEVMMRA